MIFFGAGGETSPAHTVSMEDTLIAATKTTVKFKLSYLKLQINLSFLEYRFFIILTA